MRLAVRRGWLPGARYSNLRDIRGFETIGLIDVDWKRYSFKQHLAAVKAVRPLLTVARDVTSLRSVDELFTQIELLRGYAETVIVVPKVRSFVKVKRRFLDIGVILGYSVQTGYGGTRLPLRHFVDSPVHLLGGRPLAQFKLSRALTVTSLDCNSITVDAAFGKYFDGSRWRPSKRGYAWCISASLHGLNKLWEVAS